MLAICGTAETLSATPWEDKKFEIWAVAQVATYPTFKRADLLFELHQPAYWKNDPNIVTRLNAFDGPTYMLDKYDEIPKCVRFPLDVILEKYRRYHTTSITYMLAWALESFKQTGKPNHIALFGVHMAAREEYTEQRPCCEYWLGQLEGAGVDVFMAPGGTILTSNGLYAYEGYNPAIPKLRERLNGMHAGSEQCRQELERWTHQKWKQEGAISEIEYWMRRYQLGEMQ